ncbi:MAG: DNA alkylation repair protein [Candidatus Staskawiczbacteria bacterium RIFCSPHIGHO2_02_FULL_34_10]|uniref:DNA alkylation repair protein n=1 Tax=Candidatus Staskawiczbacteria bacterium RIFCSPHIGHO2_02_FULL_34_10 TaxID=1802205 RepID=A0A1G2HXW1_9BACT|nr:MAG: DNA alkylation repair protein [Candidatus Staskawiczbacteria bacterium RIFCSPHIGHO2_02_FULL_34_10]
MQYEEVLEKLEFLKNKKFAKGMSRFGIKPKTKVYGIPVPKLRKIAKSIGKNHSLALKLWEAKIHEARLLAGFIDEPEKITKKQFEKWILDFDSWDICDQVCGNLFDKTKFVYKKIFALAKRKKEFVKRTAFTLMACLAVHNKEMIDKDFLAFFPLIKKESVDERNFIKKAVNWALRQIGKKNKNLHKKVIILAKEIYNINSKSAKWIANNAIRELESNKIKNKIYGFKR